MYEFKYHRPGTVRQAANLLVKNEDAKLIAGGHTLIPVMKQRLASPSDVIDLGKLKELIGVEVSGDTLTIKAATTHSDVASSGPAQKAIPALGYLASLIGDAAVRHRGTIGGSIANNDPAADYPAAVLALGATVVTNKRKIAADEFFKGMYETALQKGEIITSVTFPVPKRAAYMKFKNPASRYAIVGVFVADFGAGVRVAVTGAAPSVFRVAAMEKALAAKFAPESVASIVVPEKGLNSDLHAKADYRAHLVTVMAKRAVEAAMK